MNRIAALRALGVLAVAGNAAACATVVRGGHENWNVQTFPQGANVSLSNGLGCNSTPCSLRMKRNTAFVATIRRPGFKTAMVTVVAKVKTAGAVGVAGNLIIGGIVGAGIDVASGAMLDLTPNPLVLTLEPVEDTTRPYSTSAYVPAPPSASAPVATPASVGGGELDEFVSDEMAGAPKGF